MTTDDPASRGFSLKRWSQRKLDAARAVSAPSGDGAARPRDAPAPQVPIPPSATQPASAAEISAPASALPPIEALTIDSDFSAFLGAEVDPELKLKALKKLFRDPRFNVMDGLDVYIDDYSIADPLPPGIARQLAHARYLFDPPRTRVNAAGVVEDIPADEASGDAVPPPPEPVPPPPQVTAASETTTATTSRLGPRPSAQASIDVHDSGADSATGEAKPRAEPEAARR